jgi:hypothetical protein
MSHLILIALAILLVPARLPAQSFQCPDMLAAPAGDLAYKSRGDRCEGLYALPVSGSARLRLLSFTAQGAAVDPEGSSSLALTWSPPAEAVTVRLTAESLRYRVYYRMDSSRSAADKHFAWPADLLKRQEIGLGASELGLLCWTTLKVRGLDQDVYLPLSAGSASAVAGTLLTAVLVPSVELKEVYVSSALPQKPGEVRPVAKSRPVGLGFYPANRAFRFSISRRGDDRIYHVEIVATSADGGSLGADFWYFDAR